MVSQLAKEFGENGRLVKGSNYEVIRQLYAFRALVYYFWFLGSSSRAQLPNIKQIEQKIRSIYAQEISRRSYE